MLVLQHQWMPIPTTAIEAHIPRAREAISHRKEAFSLESMPVSTTATDAHPHISDRCWKLLPHPVHHGLKLPSIPKSPDHKSDTAPSHIRSPGTSTIPIHAQPAMAMHAIQTTVKHAHPTTELETARSSAELETHPRTELERARSSTELETHPITALPCAVLCLKDMSNLLVTILFRISLDLHF